MGGDTPKSPSLLFSDWFRGVKANGSCGLQDIGPVPLEGLLHGEAPELPEANSAAGPGGPAGSLA